MKSPGEALKGEKKKYQKKEGGFQEDESNWEQQRDELVARAEQFVSDRWDGKKPISMGTKACGKAVKGAVICIENDGWKVKVTFDPAEKERVLTFSSAFE